MTIIFTFVEFIIYFLGLMYEFVFGLVSCNFGLYLHEFYTSIRSFFFPKDPCLPLDNEFVFGIVSCNNKQQLAIAIEDYLVIMVN